MKKSYFRHIEKNGLESFLTNAYSVQICVNG